MNHSEISLVGKTFISVQNIDNEKLIFTDEDGNQFIFYHEQDCCEYVYIEDINGDLKDLENTPILKAECVTNSEDTFGLITNPDSFTWTFYKFATKKGYVTIRWLGESNGYYSESVDMKYVPSNKPSKLDKFLKDSFSF